MGAGSRLLNLPGLLRDFAIGGGESVFEYRSNTTCTPAPSTNLEQRGSGGGHCDCSGYWRLSAEFQVVLNVTKPPFHSQVVPQTPTPTTQGPKGLHSSSTPLCRKRLEFMCICKTIPQLAPHPSLHLTVDSLHCISSGASALSGTHQLGGGVEIG